MLGLNHLAWLYWNPPTEVFTVPLIDRPIAWYGVLFVTGFIIAYFLFIPILARFLKNSKHLSVIDIHNWPDLIAALQQVSSTSPQLLQDLLKKIEPTTLNKINALESPLKPDNQIKNTIVDALNRLLHHKQVQRTEIEGLLPGLSTAKRTAFLLADRLVWFAVLGTVIGARLGQVFFYDWELFSRHPEEIIKVWKGGLASHGGVIGVTLAIYLYYLSIKKWVPQLSFLRLLDFVAIPSALVACFIRLGNFMNQEIVGTPSNLPWAIVFGNAADGSLPIPRHAVQLYEALAYFITFIILMRLWKTKSEQLRSGFIVGLLFICIFGSRLVLEFWKVQQASIYDYSFLQMGQLLSIPFILIGLFLVFRPNQKNTTQAV